MEATVTKALKHPPIPPLTPPGEVEQPTRMYRFIIAIFRPMAWWGRMKVENIEAIPESGGFLLVANHDGKFDPVLIGRAVGYRRLVHTLAKSTLWKNPFVGWVLTGMRHIPIVRGTGDTDAMVYAIESLRSGNAVGIFPEGTISRGTELRARTGVGRLALEAPEAKIVLATIEGSAAFSRFPPRPRVKVRFFEPQTGQRLAGEDAAAISARLLAEIRSHVAPTVRKP